MLDPLNIDEPLTFVVSFDLNCGYAHQFYFNFFQSWESQPRVEGHPKGKADVGSGSEV